MLAQALNADRQLPRNREPARGVAHHHPVPVLHQPQGDQALDFATGCLLGDFHEIGDRSDIGRGNVAVGPDLLDSLGVEIADAEIQQHLFHIDVERRANIFDGAEETPQRKQMGSLEGAFIDGAAGETGEQGKIHLSYMSRDVNCRTRS